MPFLFSLLLTAATAQPTYPVEAVLRELQQVCFTDHRYLEREGYVGSASVSAARWADVARRNGWQSYTNLTPGNSPKDLIVFHKITSLNHTLFGGLLDAYMGSTVPVGFSGGEIYKKVVAGRALYLSMFAFEGPAESVGECRIHDPLGDGVSHNPVSRYDVQRITGVRLKKARGPFGSDRYTWTARKGEVAELDVHFGFKGWGISPFGERRESFDPYAPYGLTLVAGFHEKVIII